MTAVMRALPFVGLAFVLLNPVAEARPARQHVPGSEHTVLAPLEEAATACFVETVVSNPKAMRLARDGRWYEAAGVTGFLCRPEVDAMTKARDHLEGRGAGGRYFTGPYTRHLGPELARRLEPLLTTKAVANAEPRADSEAPAVPAGVESWTVTGSLPSTGARHRAAPAAWPRWPAGRSPTAAKGSST